MSAAVAERPGYAIDLFAGPGGWDVAAHRLGLPVIGIEFDKWACETRRAAGHLTIEDDVRNWSPGHFLTTCSLLGLIASPPCQTFSLAGKGAGRAALELVLSLAKKMAAREAIDVSEFSDERTSLVLDPLRWALAAIDAGHPFPWLAFEQVPTVLPVWEFYAELLRAEGYSVVAGNLQAEQYGVPQTRKRAILIAVWEGEATLPTPTHSRYYSRSPEKRDEGVLPWVSMAEALGWAGAELISNYGTGGDPSNRGTRSTEEPAATVTSKVDRNKWAFCATNLRPNAAVRDEEAPAPALAFGHERPRWVSERPATTIVGSFKPEIVAAPGYRTTVSRQNAEGSVRVTPEEAAVLQSFPFDYQWRGSKTKVFQQIGNAVPPRLAEAVLSAATGLQCPEQEPLPFTEAAT